MNFKKWLLEWEGNKFTQEPEMVNDPAVQNSRYKGKSSNPDDKKNPKKFNKLTHSFGFTPQDDLLKINHQA